MWRFGNTSGQSKEGCWREDRGSVGKKLTTEKI